MSPDSSSKLGPVLLGASARAASSFLIAGVLFAVASPWLAGRGSLHSVSAVAGAVLFVGIRWLFEGVFFRFPILLLLCIGWVALTETKQRGPRTKRWHLAGAVVIATGTLMLEVLWLDRVRTAGAALRTLADGYYILEWLALSLALLFVGGRQGRAARAG